MYKYKKINGVCDGVDDFNLCIRYSFKVHKFFRTFDLDYILNVIT